MLYSIKKVHLIGIGGIGMSGIAELLKNKEFVVSGSDIADSPNVQRLIDLGINISIGHAIAEEEALYLKKYLQSKVPNVSEFKVTELGTAIGVHGGPGAIVVGVQILS